MILVFVLGACFLVCVHERAFLVCVPVGVGGVVAICASDVIVHVFWAGVGSWFLFVHLAVCGTCFEVRFEFVGLLGCGSVVLSVFSVVALVPLQFLFRWYFVCVCAAVSVLLSVMVIVLLFWWSTFVAVGLDWGKWWTLVSF